MQTHPLVDITIIGGGPTGLFALFYTGMRGGTAQIIDALPELGGQLTALYPEKYIFDVAGFPKILAKDLVKQLAEQASQFHRDVPFPAHLTQRVTGLEEAEPCIAISRFFIPACKSTSSTATLPANSMNDSG